MDTQSASPGKGVKSVALLLMLGGIFGVVVGLYQELQALTNFGIRAATMTGIFVLLFGWCVWVGFELWHGEPWTYRWAKIIFAAQIPIIVVPGFAFDGFFTGLRIYFIISDRAPNIRWGFNLSSSIHFLFSSQVDYWLFGINFLAVIALFYLIRATSAKEPVKDKFGLI
jgi:hypothetical protein